MSGPGGIPFGSLAAWAIFGVLLWALIHGWG